MSSRSAFISGALLCAFGVALGAFGAHALEDNVTPDRLDTWNTAVRYQLVHGLGLLVAGMIIERFQGIWFRRSAILLLAGVCIFAGSLYILVLLNVPWLGALAPVGGIAMITGWAGMCLAFVLTKGAAQ